MKSPNTIQAHSSHLKGAEQFIINMEMNIHTRYTIQQRHNQAEHQQVQQKEQTNSRHTIMKVHNI